MKYKRQTIYWFCQLSGWFSYVAAIILLRMGFGHSDSRNHLLLFYLAVLNIAATHIFRHLIKRWGWLKLSMKQIIPRVLISGLVISSISIGILFTVMLVSKYPRDGDNLIAAILANIFYAFLIILLWSVIYFAVHFFENYKAAEIEKLVWEAAVKDFELKTLKSQLNPHFMFNALNSIRALIEENPERAKTAVTQLSNIFRYSLRIERVETVPLEDELRVVEDYLALEQVRYEERLAYSLHLDAAANSIEIPPMMIQTLVENGIKHGVSKLPTGGKVSLTTRSADGNLEIEITNSGELADNALYEAKGFGIANTKQRLHLLYGERASFNLINENNHVKATVIIPIEGALK